MCLICLSTKIAYCVYQQIKKRLNGCVGPRTFSGVAIFWDHRRLGAHLKGTIPKYCSLLVSKQNENRIFHMHIHIYRRKLLITRKRGYQTRMNSLRSVDQNVSHWLCQFHVQFCLWYLFWIILLLCLLVLILWGTSGNKNNKPLVKAHLLLTVFVYHKLRNKKLLFHNIEEEAWTHFNQ